MRKLILYSILIITAFSTGACDKNDSLSRAPVQNGIGGSMARFAITGNHLYTVDHKDLKLFDISLPSSPKYVKDVNLGWGIETIFPYQNHLFIGSQTGMYIYDIENPENPKFLSLYTHITACDPVVVQGDYAYVTLRSGVDCRMGQNVLDVINIKNRDKPELISSFGMYNPHGLGVINNSLFVCEGAHGLKVFDISEPENISLTSHLEGFHAYDVIVLPHVLILTGADGIYQYDYQDLNELKLLSHIPVVGLEQ